MKFAAFFVLFVVAASKPIQFDPELNEHWDEFKKAFGKNYTVSEEISRRSIWEKAVTEITQHNLRYDLGLHSYRIGLHEHSDMEHEEFVRTFFGKPILPDPNPDGPFWIPPADSWIPDHVDWREKGIVTPVKDQKSCGSCWAFSTTGALEGMHALKTGRLISLSEQNLMDCSKFDEDPGYGGCHGGQPQEAFKYVAYNGGIDTESFYPYTAQEGKCKFNPLFVGAQVSRYFNVRRRNEEDLKKAIALIGPISACIYTDAAFQNYKDGILDNPNCQPGGYHCVLIVGYGTENGKDYWLVKNSWGTSFGKEGYWKMSRNKNNQCDIAGDASFPVED